MFWGNPRAVAGSKPAMTISGCWRGWPRESPRSPHESKAVTPYRKPMLAAKLRAVGDKGYTLRQPGNLLARIRIVKIRNGLRHRRQFLDAPHESIGWPTIRIRLWLSQATAGSFE